MQTIIDFFTAPFFVVLGGFITLVTVFGFIYIVYLALAGILPVLYRLGVALSTKKIAVFADNKFDELKNILVDSQLFKSKNIIKIDSGSIKKAEYVSCYLVHYGAYKNSIDDIIDIKKDNYAMIIYAPQNEGKIDDDILTKLNSQRNTIIVNFRGRLLNDVLVSMITTTVTKQR